MTFDITPIVEAVVAVVCAVVTCVLIPYIKSKTTTEQQKEINAWVKIAVSAAEQIYTGSGRGEEKKAYVLEWLRSHGVTVDDEANSKRGEDVMISTPDSKVKVFVIPTNEELVIARDTRDIIGG